MSAVIRTSPESFNIRMPQLTADSIGRRNSLMKECSDGKRGDAFDNALMETINGLFKTECIRTTVFHDGPYRTIVDVEFATAGWVDWYNTRTLHSSLGYVPPAEFEQAHYATLNREAQPV